ncbi:hypothetical protein ACHWQZ_G004498 [Mnemiopsis leidyi]
MGDIFTACKQGDLQRIKLLVEEMMCDVNVTDKWNSTPLYYACLSGYDDIVVYLLQAGAKYDQCNFSGERCMNCALTDRTRRILRNPPKRKTFQSTHFRETMAFMFREGYQNYSDVCLVVGSENYRIYAHKLILYRQSPYFAHSLLGPNRGKDFLYLKHFKESSVEAWIQVLKYMYTQQLKIGKYRHIYEDILHISRRLGLQDLTTQLRAVCKKLAKKNADTILIETETCTYPDIADIAISDFNSEGRKERQYFADLCFLVETHRFYCHKGFVVAQSPYFSALLDSEQFLEVTTSNRGKLTFITLSNVKADTFALLLKFIYTGNTEITPETLQDLLFYSDHYMIHGLKVGCGDLLASQLDTANAVQTLSLARMLMMSKLQHAALKFIAYNFENILDKEVLAKILVLDEVSNRSNRLVRISESSVDSDLHKERDEEQYEENSIDYKDAGVDVQLDLRLYFREITNKQRHTAEAQEREEKCVRELQTMLCNHGNTTSY